MRNKITKRTVECLDVGQSLFDTELHGFVARRLRSGHISYGLKYTDAKSGRQRWLALGLHGSVTAEQARRRAQIERGRIANGVDPQKEREAALGKRGAVSIVSDLLDSHMELYVRRVGLRSEKEIARCFDRYVRPTLGKVSLIDLRRSHIVQLLDHVAGNNGPVMADRVLAHLRKALNWYAARDEDFVVPIVPGMAVTKPADRVRERVLSDVELRALWQATEPKTAGPFGALVRLLLLSAQRREEIGGMRWQDIDGDVLTIPKDQAKNKTVNLAPLSRPALSILKELPELGPFVFGKRGRNAFSGYSRAKRELDARMRSSLCELDPAMEWEPWRLHDLRRTSRSAKIPDSQDPLGIATLTVSIPPFAVNEAGRYLFMCEDSDGTPLTYTPIMVAGPPEEMP